jgi:hypothetical protein
MGAGPSSTGGGGRTDAGPKRTTATKIGVGNINEKGQKTKTTFTKEDDNRDNNKVVVPKKKIVAPKPDSEKKKKTPIVTPKYEGDGEGGSVKKPVVVKEVTKTAPTIAEVDQATTDTTPTETAETTEKNRLLKVKKRGRSSSIMTSAKGVTKTSSDYSLGRSSLLGRV